MCAENLGFHSGRPLAAVIIFRACLQWKTFQADRTTLFDRIINAMGAQIERQQDDNACLAYWLSNTVTLLYMLQRNIKPASGGSYSSRIRSPAARWVADPRPPRTCKTNPLCMQQWILAACLAHGWCTRHLLYMTMALPSPTILSLACTCCEELLLVHLKARSATQVEH